MEQWLARGHCVSGDIRVIRMRCAGEGWQIYSTNTGAEVLAAEEALCARWEQDCGLPQGLFCPLSQQLPYRLLVGTPGNLVSSLELGVFPGTAEQVLAFSQDFRTAQKRFPDTNFRAAIYLQEHGLLLPVEQPDEAWEPGTVYGTFISGGVAVSPQSYERLRDLMSWMHPMLLEEAVRAAGFTVNVSRRSDPGMRLRQDTDRKEQQNSGPRIKAEPGKVPQEPFVLTGRPQLEQFFNEHIVDVVRSPEKYSRMGISFPGAVILHGPPGCGKTYAVDRLCEYLGWERFDIDSGAIGSSYIHETSKRIAGIFRDAMDAAPSILVIDEMEAFLTDRNMSGASGNHHVEEVAEFLRRIPEATAKGVLIFAMTNMLDRIDAAIVRRGRFDHIIEISMPSAQEVESLLRVRLAQLPAAEDVDIPELSRTLAGRAMSDVTFVLKEAGRLAIRRNQEQIDMDCFREAIKLLPGKKEKNRIGFL